MYYCKSCGYRSQGNCCTNQKCADFCRPLNGSQQPKALDNNAGCQSTNPPKENELRINFRNEISSTYPMNNQGYTKPPIEPIHTEHPSNMRETPSWNLDFSDPNNNNFNHGNNFAYSGPQDIRRGSNQAGANSGCKMPSPPCNDSLQLSFASVPFQSFGSIYSLGKGLMAGTIFQDLDMPYTKRKIFGGYHG